MTCLIILTTQFFREETFQREIMCGLLNAQEGDFLLWNIERTITKIYIPVLLDSCMGDKGNQFTYSICYLHGKFILFFLLIPNWKCLGTKDLLTKVKKELLPCLRSFTSSLRVAELVWNEGTLIKVCKKIHIFSIFAVCLPTTYVFL